jgi:hypothetical protein
MQTKVLLVDGNEVLVDSEGYLVQGNRIKISL